MKIPDVNVLIYAVDRGSAQHERALAQDDDLAGAAYNLGLAYNQKGQLDEAISEFKQALECDPKLAQAYLNLGGLYFQAMQQQTFDVECTVQETGHSERGIGASRRAGEQAAAAAMLQRLNSAESSRSAA